jgi:hypothetical protein
VLILTLRVLKVIGAPIAAVIAMKNGEIEPHWVDRCLGFFFSPSIMVMALVDKEGKIIDSETLIGVSMIILISLTYWLTLLGVAELLLRR